MRRPRTRFRWSGALVTIALAACGSGKGAPRDAGVLDGASQDADGATVESDAGDAAAPACTVVDPWVEGHVAAMATDGWRAIHARNGLAMFGCVGATTPLDCFATTPHASDETWGETWDDAMPEASIRIVRELGHTTSYRSRSSPDGRFVMHGASGGDGYAVDLVRDVDVLLEDALYDPEFVPDGSGFVIRTSSARMCTGGVLMNDDPLTIDFHEPGCEELNSLDLDVGLGARPESGDVVALSGPFVPDRGGAELTTSDPEPLFDAESSLEITPLVFDGISFTAGTSLVVPTPFEGDAVLARSAALALTSRAEADGHVFVLRRLDLGETGGTPSASTTEVARYCVRGSEPSFSYDDRWIVYHHYVEADDWNELGFASASDPEFVALRASGASNLHLLDLLSGRTRRITSMGPGQYAVYAHFRSDGWIYAIVRDHVRGTELLVASDAALRSE